MNPDALIAEARSWIGTPFRANQSCKGIAADCIGMLAGAARACGLSVRYRSDYPQRPDGSLTRELEAQLVKVPLAELRPGDVIEMDMSGRADGMPHHLALYAGGTIIHAYMQARKCVEQPYTAYWRALARSAYRFREFVNVD